MTTHLGGYRNIHLLPLVFISWKYRQSLAKRGYPLGPSYYVTTNSPLRSNKDYPRILDYSGMKRQILSNSTSN
jgi:hypothetical protein